MTKTIAPAKINLYLHVTGKRDDGYHLLDSVVMFADIGDEISVKSSHTLSLQISGPFAHELSETNDNLVLQAAQLLKDTYDCQQGAKITLIKHMPIGAGMGGGSSDAATTLKLLNQLWGLNASLQTLAELSLPLGADIPMCIMTQTAHISGIGEKISPIKSLSPLHALLINPNINVSSIAVYRMGIKHFSGQANLADNIEFEHLHNDLQENAVSIAPEIDEVLGALMHSKQLDWCRMTGSGATCFGIYPAKHVAEEALKALTARHPNWWMQSTLLG